MQFVHDKPRLWTTMLYGEQVERRLRSHVYRWSASKQIRDWCNANCEAHWFTDYVDRGIVRMSFTSDRDAALFKLFFA